MQSKAKTVAEYIASLPPERKHAIETVRKTIRKHLPKGYEEQMQYGMIGYVIPLKRYPAGYLGQKDVPLTYAALASQKNHMAVYLMCVYGDKKNEKWFREAYKASGKKLDMGKSCIRFTKLENLPLDVVGKAVSLVSVNKYIQVYEKARQKRG